MTIRLLYKKIIALLLIGLIIIGGIIWYKELTTNKEAPKRANFVINKFEWRETYELSKCLYSYK